MRDRVLLLHQMSLVGCKVARRRVYRMEERRGMAAMVVGTDLVESFQNTPLQGTGVNKCNMITGA